MTDIQKLFEIEKRYDAYNFTWKGKYYWIYSRFIILQKYVMNKSLGANQTIFNTRKNLLSLICEFLRYIRYSFKNKRIEQKDIVFATHSRRVKIDGKYRCIYTDRLADKYDSSISLEQPYLGEHFEPIYSANVFYTDFAIIRSELFYYLNKVFNKKSIAEFRKVIEEEITPILREIEKEFDIVIEQNKVFSEIIRNYYVEESRKRFYVSLLRKIKPKKIVEVVHYSIAMMALSEAAHDLEIPVIELQHGTASFEHIAYQYRGETKAKCLPDYMFTFSDYWSEQISFPSSVKTISVGYDYFESQIKKGISRKHDRITILFISQETIGKKLSQIACELAKRLDLNKYRIVYKLHPAEFTEWKKNYSWLIDSKVEVADEKSPNLYEYFQESDVQVGVYSTALYEGIGYNLKTAIYNIEYAQSMKFLVKKGYAEYFDNVDSLQNFIAGSRLQVNPYEIWKMNALENMMNELDRIN